ncbi:MAG TPA: ABC transporter permease, partial [Anaerolineales bacterium]|nr:ABC transporter permease [Anaerolineales bacterium]
MGSLSRFIVRSTTFLRKELATVFRQPRLILTLILGPFLIMLLFGFAFQKTGRSLRTLFVIDPNSPFAGQTQEFAKTIGPAIIYEGIDPNKNDALTKLSRNQVDLVVVVPDNPMEIIRQNQQVELEMYHNEIDPIQVDYVNQVARLYVDALNKRVLESATAQNQQEAGSLQQKLQAAQTSAKAYHEALAQRDTAAAATQKQNLSTDLLALKAVLGSGSSDGTNTTSDQNTLNSLDAIIQGLDSTPNATSTSTPDDLSKQEQDAADIEKNISDLNSQLTAFQNMSPNVVSSPFTVTTKSATGIKLELTDFFTPAVIVLLLQHMFVTFAALSIVAERRVGTMELFKTSPISSSEILLGKTLSFFVFGLVVAAAITLLVVFALGTPMLGTWQNYIIAVIVLLLTSLAVGFFISLVSENDTQAVQFSMLLLLASIFFSGFFLDLRLMWEPMKAFSYLLPATYGINILHDVMLR